jgi:hypothetical protein
VNYCQTCTWDTTSGTVDCNKPQQQLRPSSDGVSPEGGILEQPSTPQSADPAAPIQDEGVLDQTETSPNIGNTGNVAQNGETLRK